MKSIVTLLYNTPISIAVLATRTCYDSSNRMDSTHEEIGPADLKLLTGIIKSGHTSVVEHLVYTFYITNISRACSHQLVRHRIASYSQQSTRRVKIKPGEVINNNFYVPTSLDLSYNLIYGNKEKTYYEAIKQGYDSYKNLLALGASKQEARLVLPMALKTKLMMTINARSLMNFLKQRTSLQAEPEIRNLAMSMYSVLPASHKFIFKEVVAEQ